MRIIILGFVLLSGMGMTAAQQTFSVEEATHYALGHHLKMVNAELDVRSAEKKVRETLGIGLPHVSAEGQFQNFLKIPTTVVPAKAFDPRAPDDALAELKFGTNYKVNAGATLSQLVFNGSYLVGLQASKAFANTARIMKDKTMQEIRHDVSVAYYTVLMIQNNIGVIQEQRKLTEKLLSDTKILIDEGMMEKTGNKQLELTLLNFDDALTALKGQEETAKVLLKFNMGYPIEKEIILKDDLDAKALEIRALIPPENPSFANTPDMRLLANQAMLQSLNIKNVKAAYWPVVTAFLSYSSSAQRNKFDFFDKEGKWFPTSLWGVNLSIPIYNGGMNKAKMAQAKIARAKVDNNCALMGQAYQLRWSKAMAGFRQAVAAFDNKVKAVAIAEEVYHTAEIKYKEGMMSSIELDRATMQLVKSKSDLMMARYKLVQARNELNYILDK